MPVVAELGERMRRSGGLDGLRVGMCVYLTGETAVLAQELLHCGADVAVCSPSARSVNPVVADHLRAAGARVHGPDGSPLEAVAGTRPHLVVDIGGLLIEHMHGDQADAPSATLGAIEETTTGITRLHRLTQRRPLAFPVIDVNSTRAKLLFDNRLGTGQSTLDAVLRLTNTMLVGSSVVVVGYGACGKGIALRARGMGACVTVAEIDELAALEAVFDGHTVCPLAEAVADADLVITATGAAGVVRADTLAAAKDGVLLCNAGAADDEIDVADLARAARARRAERDGVERFELADGRSVFLLVGGEIVNLTGADGDPATVLDFSFANVFLGFEHLLATPGLANEVHSAPSAFDHTVARLKLTAMGVTLDSRETGRHAP